MSGFDNAKVDAAFFDGSDTKGWRSNFLVNLGYGDPASFRARAATAVRRGLLAALKRDKRPSSPLPGPSQSGSTAWVMRSSV
jgi:hypothetical protein